MAKYEYIKVKRPTAKEHSLSTDAEKLDTLESITKLYRPDSEVDLKFGWKSLALYLFGTSIEDEVNRAIVETIGAGKVNLSNPQLTEIKALDGHSGKIPLPKNFVLEDLEPMKRYKILVEKIKAPNAIAITNLDKWFIPGVESCDLRYKLEGEKEYADKIDFLVFGSNYSKCTKWKNGWGTFEKIEDEPLFKEEKIASQGRGDHHIEVTDSEGVRGAWKGQAKPTKGLLSGKRKEEQEDGTTKEFDKLINVAFSPYTILLRNYKSDSDAKAKIELLPFYPEFKSDGSLKEENIDIKWKVAETSNKLKHGRLEIWDKFDSVVFSKALKDSELSDGEQSFTWDFKLSINDKKVEQSMMPYRVQIQGHTPADSAEGLALATMHTEVRMYVHPKTHFPDLDPYVAKSNKSSLVLNLADVWHKYKKLEKDKDGKIWTKSELAKAGFHPGPVTDATLSKDFKRALNEFQKSVPKIGGTNDRLTVSGNDNSDTRDALDSLEKKRKRPWFGIIDKNDAGQPGKKDRTDYQLGNSDLEKDFQNAEKDVILWVDDRYWYADAGWVPEDSTTVRSDVRDHATALTEAREGYAIGDSRVALDKRDIARPFIPLEARIVLLSQRESLDTIKEVHDDSFTKSQWKSIQAAIGPLRVDWTFDEIDGEGDKIKVPEVDTSMYHKEHTRSKSAIEWMLDKKKATHTRKDVKREAKYYNCLEDLGGIRPSDPKDYFKSVFGLKKKALFPWAPKLDEERESIVTIVHSDLGEKQGDDNVFTKRKGRAGVYFNPSIMAGDGYQVRAEVSFKEHASFKFPNREVLAARYPQTSQSHSAKMRTWRKASLRGYVCWGPTNSFAGSLANFKKIYAASHMHFINENGVTDAEINFSPGDLFTDLTRYRSTVKELVKPGIGSPGNIRRQNANITVTPNRLWPWHGHNQFAIPEGSTLIPETGDWGNDFDKIWAEAQKIYDKHAAPYYYRFAVRFSSEIARLIEAKHGHMRGNVIVEMQSSDKVDIYSYKCSEPTCGNLQAFLEKNGVAAGHENEACADPLCSGTLTIYDASEWNDNLPVPSLGNPVGVAMNFDGGYELWAHEVGHTRYFEHAANAPASRGGTTADAMRDLVHDSVQNPAVSADTTVEARRWDRACLMTYASHLSSYDAAKDKTYFCHKCLLKNRGWKIEGLPEVPANIKDA